MLIEQHGIRWVVRHSDKFKCPECNTNEITPKLEVDENYGSFAGDGYILYTVTFHCKACLCIWSEHRKNTDR